jgi:hypothetical protein
MQGELRIFFLNSCPLPRSCRIRTSLAFQETISAATGWESRYSEKTSKELTNFSKR